MASPDPHPTSLTDGSDSPASAAKTSSGLKMVAIVVGLTIGLALVTLILQRPMPVDPTPWMHDVDAAIAQAAAQNKIVLVYATADWCPPCRDMKRYVWPRPDIQQAIQARYLPVKIDLTRAQSLSVPQARWVQRLEIEPIPAVYRLDVQGNRLDQRIGGQSPQAFLAWLVSAVDSRSPQVPRP